MKLSYKKDYHYALIKISDLELKNSELSTENNNLYVELSKSNKLNDELIRENNNLITQKKLLISEKNELKSEVDNLKLKVEQLEDKLSHSYTLKKLGSGRPVKPQAMKIKGSVTSRSPVRNYMKEEFNYEES